MNKKYRDFRGAATLLLSVVVLASAGMLWSHTTKPYHFLTVTPGVLYRSGWMKPDNTETIIRKYGIRTIVNLCLPAEDTYREGHIDELYICRKKGVKLVNIPLAGNIPPTDEQIEQWLNLLKDKDSLPILVHCAQGAIRTGLMVAVYEMEFLEKDNKETLEDLPTFGHELNVPKRRRICDFILSYKPSV